MSKFRIVEFMWSTFRGYPMMNAGRMRWSNGCVYLTEEEFEAIDARMREIRRLAKEAFDTHVLPIIKAGQTLVEETRTTYGPRREKVVADDEA